MKTAYHDVFKTHNGEAVVSNYYVCSSACPTTDYPDEDRMTGHVWAEVRCGMGVNRINLTPDEARQLARSLECMADLMERDAQGQEVSA